MGPRCSPVYATRLHPDCTRMHQATAGRPVGSEITRASGAHPRPVTIADAGSPRRWSPRSGARKLGASGVGCGVLAARGYCLLPWGAAAGWSGFWWPPSRRRPGGASRRGSGRRRSRRAARPAVARRRPAHPRTTPPLATHRPTLALGHPARHRVRSSGRSAPPARLTALLRPDKHPEPPTEQHVGDFATGRTAETTDGRSRSRSEDHQRTP